MPFVDFTLDHRGLQARSTQSVRYVLDQIHSNQPVPASVNTGEQDRSMTPEWVIVATSQDYRLSSCEIVLMVQGIKFRRSEFGSYQGLEVRFEDRNAAFAVLKDNPQNALRCSKRDRVHSLRSREFRLFLLFSILIAALSLFFIVAVTRS